MSRIGLKAIKLPSGVSVEQVNGKAIVKGPKGTLEVVVNPLIKVEVSGDEIRCSRANEEKHTKQLHGTTRANLNDAVIGVSQGFKKE